MDYLYLFLSVMLVAGTNIVGKLYNQKNNGREGKALLYMLFMLISAFTLWSIIFCFDPSYDTRVLPYSILFAVCYIVGNIGLVCALGCGSVTLTSLFGKLSLILVSVWGFIFWNEKFSLLAAIGLVLCAVCVFLCLYKKREDNVKVSCRWLICVFCVLSGNAGCSIVQKAQQIRFGGKHGSFLMLTSVAISLVIMIFIYLFSSKKESKQILKDTWYMPIVAGGMSVGLNFLVILLSTSSLSATLVYPTLSAGGLIVVALFGAFAFKEKMRPWQYAGVALGVAAVIVLSL